MSRRLTLSASAALTLLLPLAATAAIFPDMLGAFHRVSAHAVSFQSNRAIWNEYGFQEGEEAQYADGAQKFTATAWRFEDPTGALAGFEWLRPEDSKPSALARFSADTPGATLLVHGNYVLRFTGYHPTAAFLTPLVESLKDLDTSSFPTFIGFLPSAGRVPNSERYLEGPAALAEFCPAVPPSTAAFHLSAEAQLASYSAPGGDLKLVLFSYPTPQIARQQIEQFRKIPGSMAKRAGPLVAVVLPPANPDAAEKLLSLVRYEAQITLDERVPTRRDNIGNLVINAFVLTGILLSFSLVGGLAMGGVRALLHLSGWGGGEESMIVLHLEDGYKPDRNP